MADGWFQRLTRILRIGSGWLRDRRNTGATVARDVLGRSDPASSQILDPPQPPRRQPAAPPQPADRGMRPASPPAASPPRELAVTKIESDEDEACFPPPVREGRDPDPVKTAEHDQAVCCRPTSRLPVAVLRIVDDGGVTAEAIRMRKRTLVIGRTEGDVRIPHDERISDPHAEIRWQSGSLRLRDLGSAHGTYVRIREPVPVEPGTEFRLGTKCYRLVRLSEVVEIEGEGTLWKWNLKGHEVWLGRAAACWQLGSGEDRTVSPRHARLWKDPAGKWFLADSNSLNGTWLRFPEAEAVGPLHFMLGEQRFVLESDTHAIVA